MVNPIFNGSSNCCIEDKVNDCVKQSSIEKENSTLQSEDEVREYFIQVTMKEKQVSREVAEAEIDSFL